MEGFPDEYPIIRPDMVHDSHIFIISLVSRHASSRAQVKAIVAQGGSHDTHGRASTGTDTGACRSGQGRPQCMPCQQREECRHVDNARDYGVDTFAADWSGPELSRSCWARGNSTRQGSGWVCWAKPDLGSS
ncbi:hypothetical protein SLEP1_g1416 [Rubroshorea leprosula]|uniref:Uncharacterized protein n=1 Tax=Rubroshorea leprosula TaxID=152421 RepID=A0AAV5HMG5_9ROSI|nr:hypothetical protein SLEP1_g1416 [Rubroshorea leprosula]